MVSRINSHFRYAHEKLQDASIRNLVLIDQMMVNFKTEVPDPSLLKQVFRNMVAGKYLCPMWLWSIRKQWRAQDH